MTDTEKYQAGTRIYYTGDRANSETAGTITRFEPGDKYGSACVGIQFDDSRFDGDSQYSHRVPIMGFLPGPGRRFWLLAEHEADRTAKFAAFKRKAHAAHLLRNA